MIAYTSFALSVPQTQTVNFALTYYQHLLGWGLAIVLFIAAQLALAIFVGKVLKHGENKGLQD